MGLQPATVTILTPEGQLKEIPVEQVQQGQRLVVKPGSRIAVDGTVYEGCSYVDESMLTGEPLPTEKTPGAKVYAGTINQKGSFSFIADKVGCETVLAHIIRMVQDAQRQQGPPVQQLVDRIAAIFVPTILSIAVLSVFSLDMAGQQQRIHPRLAGRSYRHHHCLPLCIRTGHTDGHHGRHRKWGPKTVS